MSDPPVALRYQLDVSEFARVNADENPQLVAGRDRRHRIGVATMVVGAAMTIGGAFVSTTVGLALSLVGVAVLTVGGLFLISGSRPGAVRQFEDMARKAPNLIAPATVVANGQGIRITSEHSDQWYGWQNYDDVRDTAIGVVLVPHAGLVRFVPSRAFDGPAEQAAWAADAKLAVTRARRDAPPNS